MIPAVLKSRLAKSLVIIALLALLTDARSADAALRPPLETSPQEHATLMRRGSRPLSRREIFQAIQNHLAQRGVSVQLRPEDLKIQSSAPAFKDDVGLQVKKIGFDPIRRETVFELWTSREPEYLPFDVTTRRELKGWGSSGKPADAQPWTASAPAFQGASGPRSKPPVLAKPGRPATLVMLGQNLRITTTVVPLQPGTKGQRILVRDLTTARVMSAEVVDTGLLQAGL